MIHLHEDIVGRSFRFGLLFSRAYDWDGPIGWKLLIALGHRRLVFRTY